MMTHALRREPDAFARHAADAICASDYILTKLSRAFQTKQGASVKIEHVWSVRAVSNVHYDGRESECSDIVRRAYILFV